MRTLWIFVALSFFSILGYGQTLNTDEHLVWSTHQIEKQAKRWMNQYTTQRFGRAATSSEVEQLQIQLTQTMRQLNLTKLAQSNNRQVVRKQLKSLKQTAKQYGNLMSTHLVNAVYIHLHKPEPQLRKSKTTNQTRLVSR